MTLAESTTASSSKGGVFIAATTLSVAAVTTWWWHHRKQQPIKKLHVAYNHPTTPLLLRFLAALPASMRRSLVLKGANPQPPLDGVDVFGGDNYNPYTEKKELVPNKLWRVRYRHVHNTEFEVFTKMVFGLNLADPAVAQRAPKALQVTLLQAQSDRADMQAKIKEFDDKVERAKWLIEAGFEDSHDMLVVQLSTTGGLLLYNPCRLHSSLLEWLLDKGPVEFIVSGSSSHTNQLPQAALAFPRAKIICAQAANDKCATVGMRQADYIYTDAESLAQASAVLAQASNNQLVLVHIQGDVFTQNLCLIANDHLFEVDLALYGNGTRQPTIEESDWNCPTNANPLYQKQLAFFQLLYYGGTVTATQAGYLPDFRLVGMDPTSPLRKIMSLDAPADDGSSCRQMAESLRHLLARKDYHYVDSVHSYLTTSTPADEFKQAVNGMWNWLDGKSLLEDEEE